MMIFIFVQNAIKGLYYRMQMYKLNSSKEFFKKDAEDAVLKIFIVA